MSDDILNMNKFSELLKGARHAQEQMEKTREEISSTEVVGEAGGGMVRIVLVGARRVKEARIDPSLLSDREMLQDLIAGAVTDALSKAESVTGEKMQSALGGMFGDNK